MNRRLERTVFVENLLMQTNGEGEGLPYSEIERAVFDRFGVRLGRSNLRWRSTEMRERGLLVPDRPRSFDAKRGGLRVEAIESGFRVSFSDGSAADFCGDQVSGSISAVRRVLEAARYSKDLETFLEKESKKWKQKEAKATRDSRRGSNGSSIRRKPASSARKKRSR